MTTYSTETGPSSARAMTRFIHTLAVEDYGCVHYRLLGQNMVLEGSVASYEAKRMIERTAHHTGYAVQNWLRVLPGNPPTQQSLDLTGAPRLAS